MDKNCIFCKIVNKEIETEFLFESENLVVFKDINPQAPVHILIVPKQHIRSINDIEKKDSEILAEMLFTAKKIALDHNINKTGYKLQYNVEKGGGQEIFHLHMHLIGGFR